MFRIIVPWWQEIRTKTLPTIPTKNIHIQPWFSTKKTVDHLTQTPTWSKLTHPQDINTLGQSNVSHSSIGLTSGYLYSYINVKPISQLDESVSNAVSQKLPNPNA